MHIAILGATSWIGRDLIAKFVNAGNNKLSLFSRDPDKAEKNIRRSVSGDCRFLDYSKFGQSKFDVVMNFVGVGDPKSVSSVGEKIAEITRYYDDLVVGYLLKNPEVRYIFISSGVVYGSDFLYPVTCKSKMIAEVDGSSGTNYYAVSKFCAEFRHRSMRDLAIVDLRVFGYVSPSLNLDGGFLLSEIARSIIQGVTFRASPVNISRDFLHQDDFYNIVMSVLSSDPLNQSFDCYSRSPVDKFGLLDLLTDRYGLDYLIDENISLNNATGVKPNYYSENKKAKEIGYRPCWKSSDAVLNSFDAFIV